MKIPALILVAVAAILPVAPASPQDRVNPTAKEQIEASAERIKGLQKKRLAALKDAVDGFTALIQARDWGYEEALEARLLLLQAELGAAEKGAERISLYKKAIDSLKEYEELANDRARTRKVPSMAALKIKHSVWKSRFSWSKRRRSKPNRERYHRRSRNFRESELTL